MARSLFKIIALILFCASAARADSINAFDEKGFDWSQAKPLTIAATHFISYIGDSGGVLGTTEQFKIDADSVTTTAEVTFGTFRANFDVGGNTVSVTGLDPECDGTFDYAGAWDPWINEATPVINTGILTFPLSAGCNRPAGTSAPHTHWTATTTVWVSSMGAFAAQKYDPAKFIFEFYNEPGLSLNGQVAALPPTWQAWDTLTPFVDAYNAFYNAVKAYAPTMPVMPGAVGVLGQHKTLDVDAQTVLWIKYSRIAGADYLNIHCYDDPNAWEDCLAEAWRLRQELGLSVPIAITEGGTTGGAYEAGDEDVEKAQQRNAWFQMAIECLSMGDGACEMIGTFWREPTGTDIGMADVNGSTKPYYQAAVTIHRELIGGVTQGRIALPRYQSIKQFGVTRSGFDYRALWNVDGSTDSIPISDLVSPCVDPREISIDGSSTTISGAIDVIEEPKLLRCGV